MAKIRAFAAFNNTDPTIGISSVTPVSSYEARASYVSAQQPPFQVRYFGDFRFENEPPIWKGAIKTASGFLVRDMEDDAMADDDMADDDMADVAVVAGAMAWNATGLNLSPLKVTGSTPFDELWAKALQGDDDIFGSDDADIIRGHAGEDVIRGKDGADNLRGDDGEDVLRGGAGEDVLRGGAGKDKLLGGSGKDKLRGGGGRDTLDGGAGADKLDGGGKSDVFRFDAGDGRDVIQDFATGSDKIRFASGPDGFDDLEITARNGDSIIRYGDGDRIALKAVAPNELDEDDFLF